MARNGEIPAIFNPKTPRVRTPSVVITGDTPTNDSNFSNILVNSNTSSNHHEAIGVVATTQQQESNNEVLIAQVSDNNYAIGDAESGTSTSTGGGITTLTAPLTLPSSLRSPICSTTGTTITNNTTTAAATLTNNVNVTANINVNEVHHFDATGGACVSESGVATSVVRFPHLKACKETCCSDLAQKMYFGVCVTVLVTASWVGATHCIKFLYLNQHNYLASLIEDLDEALQSGENGDLGLLPVTDTGTDTTDIVEQSKVKQQLQQQQQQQHHHHHHHALLPISNHLRPDMDDATRIFHIPEPIMPEYTFNAPFFAAWFFTNFSILFFPIYLLGRISLRKCDKPSEILGNILRGIRDRGFTVGKLIIKTTNQKIPFSRIIEIDGVVDINLLSAGRFLNRCLSFCILWLLTTYLYTLSLQVLNATDAIALFATNVACVYLLSWVILHEQFVGVRVNSL